MNELEELALSPITSAEDYVANFTNIIGRLDIAKSDLPEAQQVCTFIKGIVDPLHQPVVNKV